MAGAKVFHLFPKLPPEIRSIIWEMHCEKHAHEESDSCGWNVAVATADCKRKDPWRLVKNFPVPQDAPIEPPLLSFPAIGNGYVFFLPECNKALK